ncbi:F-box protein [Mesorhizobium sp. C277A]|uniref:F-box protein n=1 Tax=Mesorhizobium sp. C277A TaxID=2956827 RepID=UPI00333B239C
MSILDLPLDILVDIAERLSPIDLLRISHTNQELRVAAMIVATPQRLILLAEGLEPRSQTIALEGLGAGVGGGHSSLSHTYEYVWLKQTDGCASKPKPSSSRTDGNCAILLDMSVSSWSRIAVNFSRSRIAISRS